MVAPVTMSSTDEIVLAVVAIAILAMGVFGLDTIVFSKKRKARPNREIPKQRVRYIVEEEPDEPDAEVPHRSVR